MRMLHLHVQRHPIHKARFTRYVTDLASPLRARTGRAEAGPGTSKPVRSHGTAPVFRCASAYFSLSEDRLRTRRATMSCWICWVPLKMSRISRAAWPTSTNTSDHAAELGGCLSRALPNSMTAPFGNRGESEQSDRSAVPAESAPSAGRPIESARGLLDARIGAGGEVPQWVPCAPHGFLALCAADAPRRAGATLHQPRRASLRGGGT